MVLLSCYYQWNDILDAFIDGADDYLLAPKGQQELYTITKKENCYYQATLPYLKLEWVKDIRTLPIQYGDDHFDLGQLA